MSLKIKVKRAENLRNLESVGESDPYVTVVFQGDKKKTEVVKNSTNPEWNEDLDWVIAGKAPRADETIEIIVKDYERIGWNRLLGKSDIPLRNIIHGGTGTLDLEQTLLDANNQPTSGIVHLSITYSPPKGSQGQPNAQTTPSGKIGKAAVASAVVTGDAADGITPSDLQDTGDGQAYSGGMPVTANIRTTRARDQLSNVKTKFQVRVKIVEARQLMGSDMNPVCRVTFKGASQQTRVHRGTVSPWFDEIFFFHEECLPADMMEDFIEFKVCNSSLLRAGTLIGSFRCEVGQVYDCTDHTLHNKWLVLAHPEEATPTVQGYLKVSVSVLGPGDVCKTLESSRSSQDDIEANLLWSAGVHLQPASFKITVYLAQNLPRMDAGTMQSLKEFFKVGKASKELVDPYVVVSYAGREVQTKVLYTNDNPDFKQQLHLGFLFPSMCNTLKITLMDWDRVGEDDVIGTAIIPIDAVSAPGDDGYLPTFGPSFLNVYGARREWELWNNDEQDRMNEGSDEGCAYRGRILVSLDTSVGSYPNSLITNMDDTAFNKARLFRCTRDFILLAHLTHVSLLREGGRPLELEISMGNFGNKLENSLMPSPSSSQPTNPVFDGCKYYYLPWSETSPLITLQCQWEDVSHRLFASNFLRLIAKELREALESYKTSIRHHKYEVPEAETTIILNNIINKLVANCSENLPAPDPVRNAETSLDVHLRKRRRRQLDLIIKTVKTLVNANAEKVLVELEGVVHQLNNLAEEPQLSIPDIFIWLMSGTKRLGYARVPAADVIYCAERRWAGDLSGVFTSLDLKIPGDNTVAGVVRASLWLAREEEQRFWWDVRADLQLTVYAECYENQAMSLSSKWTADSSLMTRPPYSDSDGLRVMTKDSFVPAEGWKFQGDWIVDPDPSVRFTADAGHVIFTEEVFQQQIRVPGGTWSDSPTTWVDTRGDPGTPRDEIQCPNGWQWRDVWTTDLQRAVDAEGWEYTVQKGVTGWSPQQKVYHVHRRRRWVRERVRTQKVAKEEGPIDGWEYAMLFGLRFHARERKVDAVRRRRWRRKLVPEVSGLSQTPRILIKSEDKKDEGVLVTCPRQYLVSTEIHKYQLRAHVYQARDLVAGDKTGLSDPYANVSFCGGTQQTVKMPATLCPTWDQTLIFDDVVIAGLITPGVEGEIQQPPAVYVEIYDWDARGEPDYLGRVTCLPKIINPSSAYEPPSLQWYSLSHGDEIQGELLASFELIRKDTGEFPMPPPSRGDLFMVPFGIRPLLQKTRIEILCWGVRNMVTHDLQSVTRPSIEFECGGQTVTSSVMKNLRLNPNFDEPHLIIDVELPKEEKFMPPLTMRVMDHRSFGSKPVVATAVVDDLFKYTVEPKATSNKPPLTPRVFGKSKKSKKGHVIASHHLSNSQAAIEPGTIDTEIDWWAKFFASINDNQRSGGYLPKGYEKMEVLSKALESDPRFNNFTDLVDTIPLFKGKKSNAKPAGQFKGTFRIYPVPGEDPNALPKLLEGFPSPSPQEVTARVYIVDGIDLAPKDTGGSSDPYITVLLGKQKLTSRKEYLPNTLNPVFGRMFEIIGTLPVHKDLKVQVWDYDAVSSDDLIGETSIDLENRFLSRHRASVGLAKQYHVTGPNAWRDPELPTEILELSARLRHMDGPKYIDDKTVTLNGKTYKLSDYEIEGRPIPPTLGEERERLALHVIHEVLPLVPEHVETRDLMHPSRPGLPQGKLRLWVDLFPSNSVLPPPIHITPRKPHKYEIRVCVLNVYEAPLQESNFAGEKMSDLYVKGWLQGTDHVAKTDIHYRSLDGEGNFNWRLIFPLEYLEAEQAMVVHKKASIFSLDKTEERRPPQLTLQLWDNDLILRDDYLSEMTLDLCHMVKPSKSLSKVSLPNNRLENGGWSDGTSTFVPIPGEDHSKYVNLWEVKRVYGFFPFTKVTDGKVTIAGKLEAEIEVVHEEDAKKRPAGQGRDEPNTNPALSEPKRPATSFFWMSSPWKSFKFVLWKNYKWYIITFFVLFFLGLFLFLFLYSLPAATIDYLIGVD